MKKKIMMLGLISILLPINIKALTGSVSLSCESTTIKSEEKVKCTIEGNTVEEVSAVDITLKIGENLKLEEIETDSKWEGNGEDGKIELYTDSNKSGKFEIATFTVKSNKITGGASTNIQLTEVVLSDENFEEVNFDGDTLDIRIQSTINTLSDLTVNGDTVNGFSSDKTNYELTVESELESITLVAPLTDSSSQISGDLGSKEINYGENIFNIKVTSESGKTRTYTLKINRPEVRELKSLTLNDEEIKLEEGVYEYDYTVENEITSIDIKAVLNNEESASFIEEYGERTVEKLEEGNNEILIKVQDKYSKELTYKINVNRLKKVEKDVINPDTGIDSGIGMILLVALIGTLIYIVIKKRSKFPKKA